MRPHPLIASAALAVALAPAPGGAATPFAAHIVGNAAASQSVPFLVHVPLRNAAGLEQLVALQATPGSQAYHRWLSPAQFRGAFGATRAQISTVVSTLRSAGMSVDRVSSQFVEAHASVAQLQRTFGAKMVTYRERSGKTHTGSRAALSLPAALTAIGADVEGVVYHGEGHTNMRLGPQIAAGSNAADALTPGGARPLNRYGILGPLWFDDIKQAYQYPSYGYANGTGVTVATVNEADFSSADLTKYLQHEKIGSTANDLAPEPAVEHYLVPGAAKFNVNNGASGEADLDTQQVAGMAPGATLVGFTTNGFDFPTDFLQVYDYINETNSADIVSTSYGECELFFTAAYNGGQDFTGTLQALHDTFLQGNSEGITYMVSSGDSAGLECPEVAYFSNPNAGANDKNVPSVSIPASDPNVVAVGGGNLITTADPTSKKDLNSAYTAESAYADPEPAGDPYGEGNTLTNNYFGAGTGQSVVFAKPAWQKSITPGRGRSTPDVGLLVGGCFTDDPGFVQPCSSQSTHGVLELGGKEYEVIGTSVAAPEFAALVANIEQVLGSGTTPGAGRLGNMNPMLYSYEAALFHKGIPGFDGVHRFAGGGTAVWQPSYGLGSLFNTVTYQGPAAGIPQTATNP